MKDQPESLRGTRATGSPVRRGRANPDIPRVLRIFSRGILVRKRRG